MTTGKAVTRCHAVRVTSHEKILLALYRTMADDQLKPVGKIQPVLIT